MASSQLQFPLQIGRRAYFIWAGALVLATAILPISFLFIGGPAGWLLLFMARVRDIRSKVWGWPALALVGAEMFGREILKVFTERGEAAVGGYLLAALLLAHVCFAIALGVQRSAAAQATAS
jgi:hypothetical protein